MLETLNFVACYLIFVFGTAAVMIIAGKWAFEFCSIISQLAKENDGKIFFNLTAKELVTMNVIGMLLSIITGGSLIILTVISYAVGKHIATV